jgi:hypothetical protein
MKSFKNMSNLRRRAPARNTSMKSDRILVQLPGGRVASFVGREAWCLRHLLAAGSKGLTTIDRPAPRWSHYVFKLRKAGLAISTDFGLHDGSYPGHHGRYRLETPLSVVDLDIGSPCRGDAIRIEEIEQ